MKDSKITFIFFVITIVGQLSAQNFDRYQTLRSHGPMPIDFTKETHQKIREELLNGNSYMTNESFLRSVYYGVDEILHSGLVTYGDEITIYLTEILDRLLASEPDLRKKIHVYTLKSNVANAFSTHQGLLFVTTGLISQLENEAQLAFILAHEISHFSRRHVIQKFNFQRESKELSGQIGNMSVYSKDKEFEADQIGLSRYNQAGYSRDELEGVFDVLLYSYLPIDDIPFPKDYFNCELAYLPDSAFDFKVPSITAEEDIDDSYSSHPNIKKRKDSIFERCRMYLDWGVEVNPLGKGRFEHIRKISRFERIRSGIIFNQYHQVLYTIFLLERDNPNSRYLKLMKAKAWFGIGQNKHRKLNIDQGIKEGEGAVLSKFISKLDSKETTVLALRIITDLKQDFPNDLEVELLWEAIANLFLEVYDGDLESFSKESFITNGKFFNSNALESSHKDTVLRSTNKYDRIQSKKETKNIVDTINYYGLMLSDLMKSEEWNNYVKNWKVQKDQKVDYNKRQNLSKKEIKKFEEEEMKTDLSSFILYEPRTYDYLRGGGIDLIKSEIKSTELGDLCNSAAKEVGLDAKFLGRSVYSTNQTDLYNEKSYISTLLIQSAIQEGQSAFPVDFEEIQLIQKKYNTEKVVFLTVERVKKMKVGYLFCVIPAPWLLMGPAPAPLLFTSRCYYSILVLNTSNGEFELNKSLENRDRLTKLMMEARIYDVFQSIHMNK